MIGDRFVDPRTDLFHLLLLQPSSCERWCAESNSRRIKRRTRFKGNRVFVYRDAGSVESLRRLFTCDLFVGEVDDHKMVVCAAGDEVEPSRHEFGGERLGILHDLVAVFFEVRLKSLFECDRDRGGLVVMRPALETRDDRSINEGWDILARDLYGFEWFGRVAVGKNDRATGSAQGLVRGGGDDVGDAHREG